MTVRCALLIALLLGLAPLPGQAEEPAELPTITWLHTATRSGEIDPAAAPKSDEDDVLQWLMAHVTGYHQTVLVADVARILTLLKGSDGYCAPTMLKTEEREAFLTFSQRLYWALPARVIVLDAQAARFDGLTGRDGALPLDRLLREPGLTGAFESDRAMAPTVATALAPHRGDGNLVEAPAGATMYAMLAGRRVDWVIGHLSETRHLLDTEYPGTRFRSYAILGNTALLPDYIGCSKGPRSARIIADIDRMLRVRHLKDPAQEVYDRWLDPADQAVLHRAIAEAERNEGE